MSKLLLYFVAMVFLCSAPILAGALEIQGFVTKTCERKTGIIIYADDDHVELLNLNGQFESLLIGDVMSVLVYDVLQNPIAHFVVNDAVRARLKKLYLEETSKPQAYVFAIRFIEDLIIFMSVDGRTHVHSYSDIRSLRPVDESDTAVDKRILNSRSMVFDFSGAALNCNFAPESGGLKKSPVIQPTRIMTDPISISEFTSSFAKGYESLDSFQERTYLYAKPLLFTQRARFGLTVTSSRQEPALALPIYFQFSTGQAYRFQSFTSFGMTNQEFSPNSEPVFSLRTEAKSHLFHALFVGNIVGIPAGNSIFLRNQELMKINQETTVQPSFNYLAMMGADYGPYSLSAGFYYPTFAIKVRDEYREVLGSSVSYAVRAMYTTSRWKFRTIAATVNYNRQRSSMTDALVRSGSSELSTPTNFKFESVFWRGGIDYDFSEKLKVSLDSILVTGTYRETYAGNNNEMKFRKLTLQGTVRQSFSDYLAVSATVNMYSNDYSSQFVGVSLKKDQQESNFFGSFEFVF